MVIATTTTKDKNEELPGEPGNSSLLLRNFRIRDASVAEHEIFALTLHIEDMDDAILLDKIVAPGRLSRCEAVFTDGRPQGAYFLRRLAMMLNAT